MKKLSSLAVLLLFLLAGVPEVAAADTHYVIPGDDIQAVIDAATSGDTIIFALGTYSLSSTLNVNKSLTLTSEDPLAATKPVLDGGGTLDRIIYIGADDVIIDGLEVANGTEDLIRQSSSFSGTTIRNCIVHDSSGDEGVQLKACTDCLVECNLVYDVAQDGISIAEGSHNSAIRNNEIYNVGSENAAIYVYDSYDMTVECNYIHDTPAANGIKMYKNYGGTHIIANNLIVNNAWQGGKRCYDEADGSTINIYKPRVVSAYVVAHNTLADNSGVDACGNPTGHAVYVNDYDGSGFVAQVNDNVVTNHNGYGIRVFFAASVNYSFNDLWSNTLGATDGSPVDDGGNITADPLFNSDYTLQAGSPCIGAASDSEDMGRLFDQCGCAPNQPPVADANGPYLVAVGQPVTLDGSGSWDPDGDPLSESWAVTGDALGTIADSTFTAGSVAGITEVTLTVDDGRGGTATDTAMVVVYDPGGGFVTGGGWIDSPEGAYMPDEYPTGETFFLDTFDADPPLSDTATDDAWYPDRYRPAAFESAFFDGDNRLHVHISEDDWHGGTFYDFQGRKFNLWNDLNTYITADLYIGTDWEGNQRHASLWATTYDTDGTISGYPIAGFTEGNGFRIFTQDLDQDTSNGYQAGWYDIGLPAGFAYGAWYTIRAELTETAYRYYINGELVWTDVVTFDSVLWANMMLQAYNYGANYDVYWDNVGAGRIGDFPVGKATFGFVSKYKKGASVPTGSTEFQFKAAELNFHSSSYEWLLVTGSDYAKFKGVGTINGGGEFKFKLWAGDDDPDTFRIKIWWEDGNEVEHVVYDNGMDQPISGGNIVVHTKK